MFIEKHVETINDEVSVPLVFIKSTNIQAYPCGRRRSSLGSDGSRIPFDPEARLNTEANNRKHSGLNGFTQTYLKDWNEASKLLSLSLAGYLFNITLPEAYLSVTDPAAENYGTSEDKFGKTIVTKIEDDLATKIYANILIEDAQLFSGFQDYFTGILRDQVNTYGKLPEDSLDLLAQGWEQNEYNSYYFSGLSFSTKPLTAIAGDTTEYTTYHEKSYSFDRDDNVQTRDVKQTFVSLCILEKSGSTWKIHEPARLPKIEHGDTEDSIVVTGKTLLKDTLDVKGATTIENTLTVTEDKATSLGGTLTVDKAATFNDTLTVEDDKATSLGGTLKVADDATLQSNLYVLDNINVGNLSDAEKTITDNGGNITAKTDIKALNDLVAGNDLQVAKDATVSGSANIKAGLMVGNSTTTKSTGEVEATVSVKAPSITATTEFTGPKATITAEFIVQRQEGSDTAAVANIEKAVITEANITNEANIKKLIAETVEATDLNQEIDGSFYDVPVIFVEPKTEGSETVYQLQISRVNFKN